MLSKYKIDDYILADNNPFNEKKYPNKCVYIPNFARWEFCEARDIRDAVFSSFNSLLQSSATIVSLDLYKPEKTSDVTDRDRIKVGQYTGLAVMLLGICIAPLLLDAPEGLWQLIRKFSGFYNIPVVAIVVAAIFLKGASTKGVWFVLLFHLPAYTVITFISSGNKWYFVGIWPHIYCATHTINLFLCCKIVAKANVGTKKVKKGTYSSPFFVLLLITRYHLCFL